MAKPRSRKRKAAVVLEDSDEDEDFSLPSQRPSLVLQGSARSSPSKRTQQLSLHAFTQIRSPSADPIATVTPIPATARISSSTPAGDEETWVDKHAPKQEQHLIVHKKKAAEVHAWMEAAKAGHGPLSAVVTGPCGCGKASTIRAVATSLGLSVLDWRPSAPMLWTESSYQSGIGVPYVSKMEALQEFVQRAKMTGLDLHATSAHPSPSQKGLAELQQSAHHPHEPPTGIKGQSSSRASSSQAQLENSQQLSRKHQAQQSAPRLILVNDLPHAHDASQRAVLLDTIGEMVRTTRGPLAVLLRDSSGSSSRQSGGGQATFGFQKELTEALTAVRAQHISFNPFTEAVLARRLVAVAEAEGVPLSKSQAESLAVRSGGDLSSAINTLQLSARGQPQSCHAPVAASKGAKKGKASSKRAKGKAQAQVQTPGFDAWLDQTGSDPTLTMMHALGKFLYNKRLAPESASIVVSQPSGWFGAATTMQRRAEQSQPTQPSASQPARSQPASYSQEQASTTGLTHAQQPLGSQPFSRQPGISSCEPASTDRINVQQPPRSQPSQQSRESSKLDPGAEAGGAVSSSWPEDDGVAMADDDLVDLTMDDPLSQGQSQQQQAASQTGTLVVIEPAPELASLPMAARHERQPMAFEPEPVLMQSGLEAASVSGFLHENMLHFIDDSAIEDAAGALDYLSTTDWLLQQNSTLSSSSGPWEEPSFAASSLKDALAGSVAVRGWLYSNAHPGPRRFQAMKGPMALLVQRAAAANCAEANGVCCRLAHPRSIASVDAAQPLASASSSLFGSWRVFAGEILPYVRAMGDASSLHPACSLLPTSWSRVWNGSIHCQSRHTPSRQPSNSTQQNNDLGLLEDEIEDWEL
ncbi:hypothetical protein WJX84_010961 [Apatococcus fuscideae]|uniref:Cell cycle checkpoint protein RAD17 n=1 Tax=Apatococcus fuscideae TaxID=2026836 RepID=A0AAW1THJ8_9CHLO